MEADFANKLQSILSDPSALAKISAIASSLAKPEEKSEPTLEEPKTESLLPAISALSVQDPRITLLSSLKPLLRQEKHQKVDSLVTALTLVSMLKNFRK